LAFGLLLMPTRGRSEAGGDLRFGARDSASNEKTAGERAVLPWWNECVFYEVFVRSFSDSDGDGVGDLEGLIEKLDYLNDGDPGTTDDLGVTGLWLMPITESPSYHGYDVVDYFHVDREYGTNEDFRRLMEEARRRGIRVIVDLVLNHTSSRHPWFEASSATREGPYREYYVWRAEHPRWKNPWGAPGWHSSPNGYYYGIFWGGMPDLNYRNPGVTREVNKIIRFWLQDLGADGFRLDAIKHLIEDGPNQEHTPATHEWLRRLHRFYKSVNPDALTVGEVWSATEHVVPYIGNEVDLAFEFQAAGAMLQSARQERSAPVREAFRRNSRLYPPNQYATFLTNHDQDRVLHALKGNRDHARGAASLLLTGPGVPFLYYGEEIGQTGHKPDENIRTPMQWTGGVHAGFTSAPSPWRVPQSDFPQVNVAAETGDPGSLLGHYRRLIAARNRRSALRAGAWTEVESSEGGIYACLRHDDVEKILVLVNLTGESIEDFRLSLRFGPLQGGDAREILHGGPARAPESDPGGGFDAYRPVDLLKPYSTILVELDR
jgi:glycosidase